VQRRVVTLRVLEERSKEEAARSLSLRADHVAALLYRAKRSLLSCLEGTAQPELAQALGNA